MADHGRSGLDVQHEILRAPPKPGDGLPGKPLGEAIGKRKAQILAAKFDARDARALHHRLQAASDGLDLREFRHAG